MDPAAPTLGLTRHAYVRLNSRTTLESTELLRLLNERRSVVIEPGDRRKPQLVLVYSHCDEDFFIVVLNFKSRKVITVLPLRLWELRIPEKPRVLPVQTLSLARSRALSTAPESHLYPNVRPALQEDVEANTEPPARWSASAHLRIMFRKRENGILREWTASHRAQLLEAPLEIQNIKTEQDLLNCSSFLEQLESAFSTCTANLRDVCRVWVEIDGLKNHSKKLEPSRLCRFIELPFTLYAVEKIAKELPQSCLPETAGEPVAA